MSEETHGHGHDDHGDGHHAPPPAGADRNIWPLVLGAIFGWMAIFGFTWWLASFW
jgi:hypothetical protein